MVKLEDMTKSYVEYEAKELKKEINRNMNRGAYDLIFAGIEGAWGFDYLVEGRYGMAAFLFGIGALMTFFGISDYKKTKKGINELEALAVKNSEK